MNKTMLKISHISKQYKLGQIGGTTLREEIQRWNAKRRNEEDPTRKIGARKYEDGESFMALDDVSVEVKKGERVGIIGHNGAGKSTLLKLISRITAPTSGDIYLNGRVASMLEVGTGFHGELTGRENIYMNGAILGMKKKEIDDKIEDIIEFSECRQFIDTPVKRYSSGMYVKLAFSVAAHLDAEIMIMDEVLAVGDMAFQKKCLEKMSDVSKTEGRTILYVSHNMNTIRQLCDRCIVLSHGNVLFDGDPDEAIELYLGAFTRQASDVVVEASMRSPVYPDPDVRITRINLVPGNNIKQGSIVPIEIGLENRTGKAQRLDIRLLVDSGLGTRIMMSMTENPVYIQPESSLCKRFMFDISILSPGNYFLSAILFEDGYGKNYQNKDVLKSVLKFSISDEGILRNGQTWNSKMWGNVFNGYLTEK